MVQFELLHNILNHTTIGGVSWIVPTAVGGVLLFAICQKNMEEIKSISLPLLYSLHITGIHQNMVILLLSAIAFAQGSMALQVIGQAATYVANLRRTIAAEREIVKQQWHEIRSGDYRRDVDKTNLFSSWFNKDRNLSTDIIKSKLQAREAGKLWNNRKEYEQNSKYKDYITRATLEDDFQNIEDDLKFKKEKKQYARERFFKGKIKDEPKEPRPGRTIWEQAWDNGFINEWLKEERNDKRNKSKDKYTRAVVVRRREY